ncbi:hypothetical protein F4775DRAFT_256701 [Biscogniauxia sp. FL1348]|nr:hypothetical protein F4775DRAFT_256701 [Biscogniauxia sp. FL1348]
MYEPCGQCLRRQTTLLKYQPCMRVSVLDLQLHRKGPTISNDLDSWVQRKQQQLLGYGSYAATHVIFLTQGFGEAKENALSVKVSLFEPGEGDRTDYFWTDPYGQPRRMRMPPYFISDMEAASQSIRELLHSARSVYIETLLSDANPLVRETIQAALIHNTFGQSTLISDALELWVAARFIENQWRVFCGGVMIGLNPVNEPGNPWNGVTPITPIMDTQLDYLVIRDLLVPLSHQFLEKLKAKIDAMRRENWLEIYFAIFIVMSNFGLVIKDLIANATWKGLKPGSRGGTLTQGYMHACKTLLAYFHHACSGSVPLSLNFEALGDNENGDSGMTPDQIKYIQGIQEEMDRQKSTISNWKHISMYNDENYWCYQMLCQDWRGDIPHAGDIDDFREEDLLSSSGT